MRPPLSLLLFAGLAACMPVKSYPGPQLPQEQVATIRGAVNYYGLSWVIAAIDALDGKKILKTADEVNWGRIEILPGEHEVSASLWVSVLTPVTLVNRGSTPEFRRLVFVAEAGERYIVDGSWGGKPENNAIWIVNERTKEIVAGAKR
jgi:hypothetical protein